MNATVIAAVTMQPAGDDPIMSFSPQGKHEGAGARNRQYSSAVSQKQFLDKTLAMKFSKWIYGSVKLG
jgi:hypothetical protein